MFWGKRLLSVAIGLGFCFLIDWLASHLLDDYSQRLIVLAGLYVTLSVSLNLINGITGQFSIGHAAFYQIGAYFAGYITTSFFSKQQDLAPPSMYVAVAGVVLLVFGALTMFSPELKSPVLCRVSNALIALAAILLIFDMVKPIGGFIYIFFGLLAVATWMRSSREGSKGRTLCGVGVLAFGLFFFLLFRFWPTMPPLVWLVVVMVLGALAAGIAGFVVGLPSLRLKGDYLAIVTLGFGEIIRIQVQNTPAVGGSYGMNVSPTIKPIWMVWLLAVVCIAVSRNLIKTAHGLPFLAVREDEIASSAMGVNVTRVKVSAFVLGSAFAGAAGALLAHFEGFITPTTFAMDTSFIILTMVVLGGTGSITGSAVAAIFLSYLPEKLRGLKDASGSALSVTSASVVAALLAVVIAVALMKRVESHGRGLSQGRRVLFYIGSVVAALIGKVAIQAVLDRTTKMGGSLIAVEQLRMVIFAVTLVVLMLLRPQGIFGHHEFSWTWLKKLFRLQRPDEPTPEVAA